MRHGVKGRKLGRTSSHRTALFRNQLASLVDRERIITTLPKAKELRRIVERVVTRGRADTVASRRWVRTWLQDRSLVRKLFDDISPRFVDRPGGYTRIIKLGPRQGDGAELAVLEFVDFERGSAPPVPEKVKSTSKGRATKGAGKAAPKPDGADGGEPAKKKAAAKKPAAKEKPARKAPAKKKPAKAAGEAEAGE
jgi:large subunit ribosomal protein L17